LRIGSLPQGPHNAITDVAGVRVGHCTLIDGEGALEVGKGPIRTGVTVVLPHEGLPWEEPLFAGCHRLNGNGDLTGLENVRESGLLCTPIALTNTHSLGTVRDTLVAIEASRRPPTEQFWSLPVVGETWDGLLNDINGFHVQPQHIRAAFESASSGQVAEGNVGGGTGMICHGFKGGIGTSSRVLPATDGGFTVGVLVQANHGARERLEIDGFPVGRHIPTSRVPLPSSRTNRGSIIVLVATDAPLLPHQCSRLAQRAGLGIARTGGLGEHWSGDLFLAFATGNRGLPALLPDDGAPPTTVVLMLSNHLLTPLFAAVVEATEEAIVNALLAADTMTGRDGITAYSLDGHTLVSTLGRDQ
jgi:D-aminopeptidase